MSNITVGDTRPFVQYSANGSTLTFSFDFPVLAASDLVVRLNDGETPGGYAVNGVGQPDGGSVTFSSAPAAGTRVSLYRAMPVERGSNFLEGADFRASALNAELNRLALMVQQAAFTADTAIRRASHDLDVDLVLPPRGARAGSVLGFDSQGRPEALPDLREAADHAVARAAAAEEARDVAIDQANQAGVSRDAAASSASAAESARDAASSSANTALSAESGALDHAAAAEQAREDTAVSAAEVDAARSEVAQNAEAAQDAKDRAELWADEAEDVAVEAGRYSARHWAEKIAAELPVILDIRRRGDLAILREGWAARAPTVAVQPDWGVDFRLGLGLDGLTIARAGPASYFDSGGRLRFAGPDELRLDHDPLTGQPLGALVEDAATNLLHDSLNPASQTRSLAAGVYSLSLAGPGSVTVSGGAEGTASAGSPLTFALDSSASVTFTVDGSPTAFQCEAGPMVTSIVETPANGAATRAPDDLRARDLDWLTADAASFVVTARLAQVPEDRALRLLTLDDGGAGNRHNLFWNGPNSRILYFSMTQGAAQGERSALINAWGDGESHTLGITIGGGLRKIFADGVDENGDTIAEPQGLTTLRLGSFHGGAQWNGHIQRVTAWNRHLSDAELAAVTG